MAYEKIILNSKCDWDLRIFGRCGMYSHTIPKRCHWPKISDIESGAINKILGLPENPKLNEISKMYTILTDLLGHAKNENKSKAIQKMAASLLEKVEEVYRMI